MVTSKIYFESYLIFKILKYSPLLILWLKISIFLFILDELKKTLNLLRQIFEVIIL